jgi:hypothetical protein
MLRNGVTRCCSENRFPGIGGFMGTSGLTRNLAFIVISVFILTALSVSPAPAASVSSNFLYALSDFTGAIPFMGGRVHIDKDRGETYVLYQNIVKVFNDKGMEIYRFGYSEDLGRVQDIAVDREGDILTLSYVEKGTDLEAVIIRCNYRGDPLERIAIKGIPSDFKEFHPGSIVYREGQIYLCDGANLRIAVIDTGGQVQKTIDLVPISDLREEDRGDVQLGGFSVDDNGNILYTLPVLFTAMVLFPDGKTASFGEPGSLPGKFGVISDITRDSRGNIFVADRLKSVINIFDSSYNFLMEFGGRGSAANNLIVPQDIAVDNNDRLYVTQLANRGVSVFRLYYSN